MFCLMMGRGGFNTADVQQSYYSGIEGEGCMMGAGR